MVCKEFLQTMPRLCDEILFEKVSKCRILLGFWHVRHGEQNELVFIEFHFRCSCLEVFLESNRTAVVKRVLPSEVRVDVIDAEVDLQIEL